MIETENGEVKLHENRLEVTMSEDLYLRVYGEHKTTGRLVDPHMVDSWAVPDWVKEKAVEEMQKKFDHVVLSGTYENGDKI